MKIKTGGYISFDTTIIWSSLNSFAGNVIIFGVYNSDSGIKKITIAWFRLNNHLRQQMPQKDLIKYLIVYLSLHDHYDSSFFYANGKETVKFKPKQNIAKDLLTVVDVSIY